jgi:hypothetical protein
MRGVIRFEFRESGALMEGFQTTRKKCHIGAWTGVRLASEPSRCTKAHLSIGKITKILPKIRPIFVHFAY